MNTLVRGKVDLVFLNPSLDFKSLIRDGIFIIISRLFRKQVIVFFRGWISECEQHIEKKYLSAFKFVFFRSNALMVLAEAFSNKLKQWGYQEKIYVETTIVESVYFDQAVGKLAELDNRNDVTLLYLARIERVKGIYEAIAAYQILCLKYKNLRFLIAGGESLSGSLEDMRNVEKYIIDHSIPNVNFLGFVSGTAKEKVLMESDILLFPSGEGEGMPNAVLESMAFGLAIVTSTVGGLVDFFQNEKMGYMTNSISPHILADLCEKLILSKTLRKEIAFYNHQYAREHFSSIEVAHRLVAICSRTFYGEK